MPGIINEPWQAIRRGLTNDYGQEDYLTQLAAHGDAAPGMAQHTPYGDAMTVAATLGGAGRGLGAAGVADGPGVAGAGIFVGPRFINKNSETHSMFNGADRYAAQGASPEDTWSAWQVGKLPGGQKYHEISDTVDGDMGFQLKQVWRDALSNAPNAKLPLGDIATHPDLFEALPTLAKLPIDFLKNAKDSDQGQVHYSPLFNALGAARDHPFFGTEISVNKTLPDDVVRQVLLHELQHAVAPTGLPHGSSTAAALNAGKRDPNVAKIWQDIYSEEKADSDSKTGTGVSQLLARLFPNRNKASAGDIATHRLYQAQGGEQMARAVGGNSTYRNPTNRANNTSVTLPMSRYNLSQEEQSAMQPQWNTHHWWE